MNETNPGLGHVRSTTTVAVPDPDPGPEADLTHTKNAHDPNLKIIVSVL